VLESWAAQSGRLLEKARHYNEKSSMWKSVLGVPERGGNAVFLENCIEARAGEA
jgi:hypothetical protein